MGKNTEIPKVNAGSMADIAFLLLIFFLVTTSIETDVGMERMLPKIEEDAPIIDIYKRNMLQVLVDGKGDLLVNGEPVELNDLSQMAKNFLDNGGFSSEHPAHCGYCEGLRDPKSSDNPSKAIISVGTSRETKYEAYIAVQNELLAAYNALRNREAQRRYQKDYTLMEAEYLDSEMSANEKEILKRKIKHIQELFPLKLTEVEIKK